MLFYRNIAFCLEQKYMLIYFFQYHVWLSEKNAFFIQRPNITINNFGCYTQVFFITTTCP